jgi:hypothetical protein
MPKTGTLLVFEGPDGVGKSTLVNEAGSILTSRGIPHNVLSFPGKDPGTLGWVVDQIHHTPEVFEGAFLPTRKTGTGRSTGSQPKPGYALENSLRSAQVTLMLIISR